jgi:FkbM family methyltransferase
MYKSYSHIDNKQIPLDIKLDKFLQKEQGFFIELGANDGLTQSNTAFLEFYRNWKGILVEPSIDVCKQCINNRPNSKCFNFACVSNDYESEYILGDFNGHCMSSVGGKRANLSELIKVPVITLEKLLDMNEVTKIYFLSLDAEGYELPILKGLNLDRYRPLYMLIEIYIHQYDDIVKYLIENNYSLHSNFTNYNNK